jgi:hypothetical protein
MFPVHLHFGDIGADKAQVAAQLKPILGKTGKSETVLTMLADESPVTFNDLKTLEACVKIHLAASGENKDIILAAGNIGSAAINQNPGSRLSIGLCKSE